MVYSKQQEEEILTIKERTITLKLSDADCDRLLEKADRCGICWRTELTLRTS